MIIFFPICSQDPLSIHFLLKSEWSSPKVSTIFNKRWSSRPTNQNVRPLVTAGKRGTWESSQVIRAKKRSGWKKWGNGCLPVSRIVVPYLNNQWDHPGCCLLTRVFGFTPFLMKTRNQQLLFIATPYFLLPGLLGVWFTPGRLEKDWNQNTQMFICGQSRFSIFIRCEVISLMFVLINLTFFSFALNICLHISLGAKVEQKPFTRCLYISLLVYFKEKPSKGSSLYQAKPWEKKMKPERLKWRTEVEAGARRQT